MKVLIAGSSGLIGNALFSYLQQQGFQVGRLLRHQQDAHPYYDIDSCRFYLKDFSHPDIIINLAGENIADGRWSAQKKQRLIDSRIQTTACLAEHFKATPPKVFINASAIGFYGERGNTLVDEKSDAGDDFVSHLAQQWEKSCQPLQSSTRLVKIRTGIVLSKEGGALSKMLPAFKIGLGGKVGSGQQWMSWIDINDICDAILFIIQHNEVSGPINLVSPNPVNNQEFSQQLSQQLSRPCIFPLPDFMVKLLFAEMGKELLLASTRVIPNKLLDAGFTFSYPLIAQSLSKQLQK